MITLTNGVQIPENAVQLQTTAAIDGYYVTQPLRLVQYDQTLPVAAVQLTYQNQPYTPPTGAELNVRMGKPDGKGVYNPCLGVDSNGVVYFAFTLQMTIVAGYGTLTVEVTDSGVKNSAPIIVDIRRNPVPEGAIESADEFLTLQEILAEAEKWGQIVQANAANIQEVVDNLEDIQNAAENAQAAAESAAAAQQAAQEALGFRKFYSAVVPDSNGNLDPSRPMTVGPAASVEIESKGDRIQSVTAFGFTTQAGSGDPSPSNVRVLTCGGLRMTKVVLGNGMNFVFNAANTFSANLSVANSETGMQVCSEYQWSKVSGGAPKRFNISQSVVYVVDPNYSDASSFNAHLSARYAAGDPVTVWYVPADESQATGLYAPIILQGGEYRATCLPLTAPLCEGDSVVSWVKSGCDKVVTFDGSKDEQITIEGTMSGGYVRAVVQAPGMLGNTDPGNAFVTNWVPVVADYDGAYTHAYNASNRFYLFLRVDNVQGVRNILSERPLTVWYATASYTEAADIPVSLETHQQAVRVLDGTEAVFKYDDGWADGAVVGYNILKNAVSVDGYVTTANILSSHLKKNAPDVIVKGTIGIGQGDGTALFMYLGTGYASVEAVKTYLAAQYAAGTPVTIVYGLATPITYAHPAVVLEAATGDQLTYTVTGQSGGTVSVSLKPFQDGGHAKTADSATNAVTAQTAVNSQQLGGLSLSALQNLLVPVGYIFSWAPTSGGPDLSTAQKVAEYFGFGTWAAYGAGQVLVGVDSGQTEFATPGKTGGEKTNTLGVDNIPSHTHGTLIDGQGVSEFADVLYSRSGAEPAAYTTTTDSGWGLPNWGSAALSTTSTGGGQAHNNLQPYVTVYRWQRIA